ncbi:MAG: tRNA (adenosine(37)-N6)-threonylcarbamoyltransferase complex ATPase subunit type 1 TsaE [Phycisphaerales bacterium]|nr:tRNA (adenosine(37)-N6)-threonylcarbamoyltransferase complex ATPase subunit type 1 TsaE [Phycisphaerales bacterium]
MTLLADDYVFESDSADATFAWGRSLGRCIPGGTVIGLVGPLGAGKTHLVKGIAFGNAGDKPCEVTSPTFTLVHEYAGRLTLFHLDAYRLNRSAEVVALGFDEMIREDSAVVVEWAHRVRDAMPFDTLWIEIAPLTESSRRLIFRAGGKCSSVFLESLRELAR